MIDLTRLNPEQIKAVKQIDGPLLILAGAGSGKTTTMTYRIAYMIEQGIDPFRILAVTFTNKAAGEMRSRVEALVPDISGMWIMTFHAMCLRMLRYHAEILGYKNNFTIYDETDKKALIKRICKELNVNDKEYPVNLLLSVISSCKESELTPEAYLDQNAGDFRSKTIYSVYVEYSRELMRNNAMDFDDLLWNGVRILEQDPKVLAYYRGRFRYIMVDEYQDTNFIQYKLIKFLSTGKGPGEGRGSGSSDGLPRNLCVVGDDDQCIYEWRGADIRNILEFEKDFPDARVIKLEQNYRSDGNILGLANSVIRHNRGRKGKELWTAKGSGDKITYRRLPDEKQEAWYIGSEIERLRAQGYNYRDFAVLYRKNAQSRPFEDKFMFRGIPYTILAGMKFYERKEIKDVIAYLRLIDNPGDDVSMLRVINEPKRGVGPKTLAGVQGYAKSYGISLYEALRTPEVLQSMTNKPRTEVGRFVAMIAELSAEKENLTIEALYDNMLTRSGYLDMLKEENTAEADGRIENIMEFKSVISEFEQSRASLAAAGEKSELELESEDLRKNGFVVAGESELGQFLAQITLRTSDDDLDETRDEVVLMTLHSAKGLEFPVVFMPGMENGVFPGASSFDEESRLEEERRLCYVGITRAMQKLYLTSAETRMMYGRTDYSSESMFLGEMDTGFLTGDRTAAQKQAAGGFYSGQDGYAGEYTFRGRSHGTADGYYGEPARKPFDPLAFARRKTEKKISNEGFVPGDILIHPKFGEGMLIEQTDKTMTVAFDSVGIKKLGKGFVELKKKE